MSQRRATRQAQGLTPRQTNPAKVFYRAVGGLKVADLADIMTEWHPTRNTLDPSKVPATSLERAWWQCQKDQSHEWAAEIRPRATKRSGCPVCHHKLAAPGYNLEVLFPEIAEQWHPTRNGSTTPRDVLPQSNKLRWWICDAGHEFEMRVHLRTTINMSCPDPTHRTYKMRAAERRSNRDSARRVTQLNEAGEASLAGDLEVSARRQVVTPVREVREVREAPDADSSEVGDGEEPASRFSSSPAPDRDHNSYHVRAVEPNDADGDADEVGELVRELRDLTPQRRRGNDVAANQLTA